MSVIGLKPKPSTLINAIPGRIQPGSGSPEGFISFHSIMYALRLAEDQPDGSKRLFDENLDMLAVFIIHHVDHLADLAGINESHQLVYVQAFDLG